MSVKFLAFVLFMALTLSYSVSAEKQIASDGFESNSWTGGTGWNSGWYHSGDTSIVTNNTHSGTYQLQFRKGNGYVDRSVNLAGYSNVTLRFFARVNSFEATDSADFMVSSDGVNWTVVKHFTSSDSDNTYHLYQFNISPSSLSNNFYIAVDGQMSAVDDFLFLDDLSFVYPGTNVTPVQPTWHIQFNPAPNPRPDVAYWNLDLFDIPNETMQSLHANGTFVMCYFSAGSWEDWRPDANQFPSSVLGNNLAGWPGEKYLDIRSTITRNLMQQRMAFGIAKGCDGFDPDNMDSYQANSGFPLTANDTISYYNFLADYAHSNGKKIGLKNTLSLITVLLPKMDWEINEQCFAFSECGYLAPVVLAGKPVFNLEYASPGDEQTKAADICPQANVSGFTTLIKHQSLDGFEIPCLSWSNVTKKNLVINTTIAYDGFENGWTGGTGKWTGGWYSEGDASIVTTASPAVGNDHLRLRTNTGYVDRNVNLQGFSGARLTFKAKVNSFEAADVADLSYSPNGINWTVLKHFTHSDSDNKYHNYTFDITNYGLTNSSWISIDSEMGDVNDQLYVDEISFQGIVSFKLSNVSVKLAHPVSCNMTNQC